MNILLTTAVMIASLASPLEAEDLTYELSFEAEAKIVACPADARMQLVCFTIQNRMFAIDNFSEAAIGEAISAKTTFNCDFDEKCKVTNISASR